MNRSYSAVDLRIRNFRVVFELARLRGELLRPDISSHTGMTPPTVMKVVQSFLARNILKNAGEVDTLLGRKPTRLTFNPNAAYAIGVLFEGGEMHAGLVNLAGEIINNIKIPMDYTFSQDTLPTIIDLIRRLITDVNEPILGIGLGVPGVVNSRNRIIEFAPLIGIVKPMDCSSICDIICNETGLNVCMDNDVNAAAVGEFSFRKLHDNDDLLYISVGTGVGAGIILNGQLRRGARNLAGELGYAVNNARYHVDRTLPGWLEGRVGQKSLKKHFDWLGYGNDDEVSQQLIDYLVGNLAPAIANLATQLDIKSIIIGGMAMDTLGEHLRKPLQDKIDKLSLEPVNVYPPACVDSGVTGAAILAMDGKLDEWLCTRNE